MSKDNEPPLPDSVDLRHNPNHRHGDEAFQAVQTERWRLSEELSPHELRSLAYFLYGRLFGEATHYLGDWESPARKSHGLDPSTPSDLINAEYYVEHVAAAIGFNREVMKQWLDNASREIAASSLSVVGAGAEQHGAGVPGGRNWLEMLDATRRIVDHGLQCPTGDHFELVGILEEGPDRLLPYASESGLSEITSASQPEQT